jgi:hypothetical protein
MAEREELPSVFSPGSAGLFSFFANEPTSHEALVHRRKIAEALAAQKRGFPKNVGEGLTYLGESIGEAGLNYRLRQQEAARDAMLGRTTADLERGGPPVAAPVVAPASPAVGPRAAVDPAVSETVAAAEDGTEAPPTRLSYAPEAPRDLPPEETAAAPVPDSTAVSRPPASILPMQDQRPPVPWTELAQGAKPGRPMEGVAMRTVPDPGNAQLRSFNPQAFFDNAPSMPMEPGFEGTPRLGGDPSSPTAGTFASRYDALPGAPSQVALADAPAEAPQVADVPLPRPRPEAPLAAVAGGPTFRTERNAEVGSRVGFDRAVTGMHPELQARLQAAYNDMPEDVRKSFVLNEGARTKEYQQYLYDTRSGRGMVARPGHSRHESGEAADVDRGEALDWLHQNGPKYGLSSIKGDYPHIQMTRGGRQFFDPANPVALNAPGGSNVAVANGGYNAIDAAAAPVQVAADTPRQAVTNAMSIVQARDAPPSPTDAAQVARTQDVLGMGSQARLPATASLGRTGVVSDAPPLGVNPVSPTIDAGVAEATQQRNAIAKELLQQQQKIPVPEEPATGPTQAGTAASPSPTTTDNSLAATSATSAASPRLAQAPSPVRTDAPAPAPSSVLGPQGASPPLAPTAGAVRAAPPQAVPSMELPPKLGEAPPTFDEPRPTKPAAPTRPQPGPIEANALRVYRSTDDPEIQRRAAAVAAQYQKIRDDTYARDVEAYKEDMKHFSASDSAWVKRKDEALQHHLDRQHKANEIIKQYEEQAGRLPAGGAAAPAAPGTYDTRLGTEASPQRSGVPSIPPVPPGIAPDKWREAHTTKAIADTEAVEKAGPDFAENLRLLKLARAHPGKDSALGFFGKIARSTPGTDAAGFQAITDQIAGKNFLAAYQQLRGTGAISEMEGKKAEDAQARLSLAQNKEDYDRALVDFEQSLRRGMERAQRKVNAPVTAWRKDDDNESYAPDVGERRGSMEYIGGNPAEQSSWRKIK